MAKNRNLSVLVEKQLPEFISSEYENFSKFLQKYYEQLESVGQPLDIIGNIEKYRDIDYYEKSVLTENTVLSSSITASDTTISVQSTEGFPKKNGYISINDEIIFYKTKTDTTFVNCYRNVSGTTKLGDIYHESTFKTVNSADNGSGESHQVGSIVANISNLFLYAFVKNFEKQYLDGFPEELLKQQIDKKVLIKNIKDFYRAKGTDQSIKFIFNSIVAQNSEDIPSVYYPKDSTFKASSGEWIDKYSLQVKVLSGNVTDLIGSKIVQDIYPYDSRFQYAFAIVDDVIPIGDKGGETLYEIVLAEETVNGRFEVTPKTYLTRALSSSLTSGNRIDVYSTSGWNNNEGDLIIGNETIFFRGKNVNQFTILNRNNPVSHPEGTPVYSKSVITGYYEDNSGNTQEVKLLSLGYLYDLKVSTANPYSKSGDKIEISSSGSESLNVIYKDLSTNNSRWKINETFHRPSLPAQPSVAASLNEVIADVSSVYEDDQYFYIASSGFPSHNIGPFTLTSPQDQKNLKLIKKYPTTTTEIYETPANDVGVLVNGVKVYGYKDFEQVIFGSVERIEVTNQGNSYAAPPFVLINGNATARAVLSGETVDHIIVTNPGSGYTSDPQVTITSGRNAVVTATVTGDRVTRLNIVNPGEYYSSPPLIVINDSTGRGRYARYTANVSSTGEIIGFNKLEEGRFYNQDTISVTVIPVGSGSTATASVKRWRKNRYTKNLSELDYSNGAYFTNNDPSLGYGYGYVANPRYLRIDLNDNLDQNGFIPTNLSHSPILGYAYDGNPIYGPYGYSNPLNSSSAITRITSSYTLKTSRPGGPTDVLGTFIEDYQYNHRSGMLDENNGRYCVTPEYPNGIYAYFLTIDASNNPVFPYFIGKNFYSLPVDSNYTGFISQNELPANVKRLRTSRTPNNGIDIEASIDSVTTGGISNATIVNSHNNFSVGSKVYLEKTDEISSAEIVVSELKGKEVSSIESRQTKIIQLTTQNNVYLFNGDVLTQQNTGAIGEVVGDSFNTNEVVLRIQYGTFDTTNTIDSSRTISSFVLDRSSSFSQDSFVSLTNGKQIVIDNVSSNTFNVASNPFSNGDTIVFTSSINQIQSDTIYFVTQSTSTSFKVAVTRNGAPVTVTDSSSPGALAISQKAYGRILRTSSNQNTTQVETLRGRFEITSGFYLNSNLLSDTLGAQIVRINQLSNNITAPIINDSVALVTTSTNHGITVGDVVDVDIIPDSSSTTTNYQVRKRIYQEVTLEAPEYTGYIQDNGLGSGRILNSGEFYAASTSGIATFNNVELYFVNQERCRDSFGVEVGSNSAANPIIGAPGNSNNARANITVSGGKVVSVVITNKGSSYRRGDLLTINAQDLDRGSTPSTRYLVFEVLHAGFAVGETLLKLGNIDQLSNDDLLRIGNEIVRVSSTDSTTQSVTVVRGVNNTPQEDHFNSQEVTLYQGAFRFSSNYQIGTTDADPRIISYTPNNQRLTVAYSTAQSLTSINEIIGATTFFDESTPRKIVSIRSIEYTPTYKFEFSSNSGSTWSKNPIIEVQRYYTYQFDLSDTSLSGSFLDFSPSGNFNILSSETRRSSNLPGTPNSFVRIVLGLGNFHDINSPQEKEGSVRYTNYFYYDKAGIIDADQSYLRIIEDPLQGRKTVSFVTPNAFLYNINSHPQYDGSGVISYTTTSITASGEISKFRVSNPGTAYTEIPSVMGVAASSHLQATIVCEWDSSLKSIQSVTVTNSGSNYSIPKVVVDDGDGNFAEFRIFKNSDNSIRTVEVINPGRNYTYRPTLKIIETDVEAYCESNNIGIPKSVKLKTNGYLFDIDKTTNRTFTSSFILTLKDFESDSFLDGEQIVQYDGNNLIAQGYVVRGGWKPGRNFIKLEKVSGVFKEGIQIRGNIKRRTATVQKIFTTIFNADIKPYYDNMGYFSSDKSILSSSDQRITDSNFYQDYSYVIRSKTPINIWRNIIKNTIHPAGFNVFGEVQIESSSTTASPSSQPNSQNISILNLWDPIKNVVTVSSTTRKITNILVKNENINVIRGKGSVTSNEFDTGETLSYEFVLNSSFNGYFNDAGNRTGNKTFTMQVLGSSNILTVSNIYNTIVSLDGIVQEPSKSYYIGGTVGTNDPSSSSITFAEAPLGYRDIFGNSITQAQYDDGLDVPSQKFIGRYIKLKNNTDNNTYFKKIRDISSQFDNVRTTFDLYYEDNTPVQLSSGENLLVSIDGVIQRQGVTPVIPFDRSYYIRKTVVPNQIVFVEPPRKLESQNQKFFAFNISGAERLKIDENYIDGIYTGSYILRSSLTEKTISIDEERNLLVFVDGVLQDRKKSYVVNGANIRFTEPLKPGVSVYILLVYGKKIQNSLTAFNFEEVPFFNRFEITISGKIEPDYVRNLYDVKIKSNSSTGTIKKSYFDGVNTILTVDSLNPRFLPTENIIIENATLNEQNYTINSSRIISIDEFEKNDDSLDILRKSYPNRLIDSPEKYKISEIHRNFVETGDLIKIDGENSYRVVLSVPTEVLKTDYRNQDDLSSSYYGKIPVTGYNDISFGEGLDVVAEVSGGRVTSLVWNKKDFPFYRQIGLKPKSNAFGYETAPQLRFVAQPQKDSGGNIIAPAQGGGAKAFAIVENGEVIDIVLYDGGSGYVVPPRVYVTKKYNIIKKSKHIDSDTIFINILPSISVGGNLYINSGGSETSDSLIPIKYYTPITAVTPASAERTVICTVQKLANTGSFTSGKSELLKQETKNIQVNTTNILDTNDKISIITISSPIGINAISNVTINAVEKEITNYFRTFLKLIEAPTHQSMHDTGAYLVYDIDNNDTVIYVADTSKFTSSGKLLVEDEIVYYDGKLNDRFYNIERGYDSTTAKGHLAGSFIRQYSENVTLVDVSSTGVVQVESTVSNIADISVQEISSNITSTSNIQVLTDSLVSVDYDITIFRQFISNASLLDVSSDISSHFDIVLLITPQIQSTPILEITCNYTTSSFANSIVDVSKTTDKFYEFGVIDQYYEAILVTEDILSRSGSIIYLDEPYNEILLRSGDIFEVKNSEKDPLLFGTFLNTNVGNVLKNYNEWYNMDDGVSSVSSMNLAEFDVNYQFVNINDFTRNTQYTKSGFLWNLTRPSIQNPVALSSSDGNIGSTITVQTTVNFPSSGYLYHSNGTIYGVIQYTGKTSTTFTGCTVYTGSSTISNTSEIIPYSI